jgi:hypothetical protein
MENNEENKISADTEVMADKSEAQILEPERVLEEPKNDVKKKKYDFYIELALFFILGILLGVALKNEAVKRITIGFDDYKMKIGQSGFDINQIEKDLLQKQQDELEKEQNVDSGGDNN